MSWLPYSVARNALVLLVICLHTFIFAMMPTGAKFYKIHWNSSNPIFRIDNRDNVIEVNRNNSKFEYDQVNLICPVYTPGTKDEDMEQYIIYNVSKDEYETCRITNPNPRIIAICDKPYKLMYFTITFRSFSPQRGEPTFMPGHDYYFISTSTSDDLHRRIEGRCISHNIKIVFRVWAPPDDATTRTATCVSSPMGSSVTPLRTAQSTTTTTTTQAPTTSFPTFYTIHWNSSSPIFRIDSRDTVIEVNSNNLKFEYDQVNLICPVYTPGTKDEDMEKYIIYIVSKDEYETCRITNPSPRIIAVCDKPYKLMYFTITFRPFSPQAEGLKFMPGHDYYLISTSTSDDLHRRIGGRCTTHNMKLVFKVWVSPDDYTTRTTPMGSFVTPSRTAQSTNTTTTPEAPTTGFPTFYTIHWNSSNPIFRIDSRDNVIEVNSNNLKFEYDQINLICPVYTPGTKDEDIEKYIIYIVSRDEYETCRITNPNPRIIAVCDKPYKLMYFTITFRPFSPQAEGLKFMPGHDYYLISTSTSDDLHRRIGGRCTTHNMKLVFKVWASPDDYTTRTTPMGSFVTPSRTAQSTTTTTTTQAPTTSFPTFYTIHWNSSSPIFRIDSRDTVIEVNSNNLKFEYDQVNLICPVYTPGTKDEDMEKYIIYIVSKDEYETCRITNPSPRIIAVCDKPYKLMYFTITFRPFSPQAEGLKFMPGHDYYLISTSTSDDLHRRIGGRCTTHNMKLVFKVWASPDDYTTRTTPMGSFVTPSRTAQSTNTTTTPEAPTTGFPTFYTIHWNSSNPIFRIDSRDNVIEVNSNNLKFEYDQINLICPVYTPGTKDEDIEKYIIYIVSRDEYETCRITNPNPKIIAVCDKPYQLMYFTITFRPFSPQAEGLKFMPGHDYYLISTSTSDDLHRRIGGRCITHNMKIVFKVWALPDDAPTRASTSISRPMWSSVIPSSTTQSITTTTTE